MSSPYFENQGYGEDFFIVTLTTFANEDVISQIRREANGRAVIVSDPTQKMDSLKLFVGKTEFALIGYEHHEVHHDGRNGTATDFDNAVEVAKGFLKVNEKTEKGEDDAGSQEPVVNEKLEKF